MEPIQPFVHKYMRLRRCSMGRAEAKHFVASSWFGRNKRKGAPGEDEASEDELPSEGEDAEFLQCQSDVIHEYRALRTSTVTSDERFTRFYDTSEKRYYEMYDHLRGDRLRFLDGFRLRKRYAQDLALIPDAACDKIARAVPAFLHCPCRFCLQIRSRVFHHYVTSKCKSEPALRPPSLHVFLAVCLREILLHPCLFVQRDDPRVVVRQGVSTRPATVEEAQRPDFVPRLHGRPPFTCLLFPFYTLVHEIPAIREATVQDRIDFWKIYGTMTPISFQQFARLDVGHIQLPETLAVRITELTAALDAQNVALPPRRTRYEGAEIDDSDV